MVELRLYRMGAWVHSFDTLVCTRGMNVNANISYIAESAA
jgi:hypothetical protein